MYIYTLNARFCASCSIPAAVCYCNQHWNLLYAIHTSCLISFGTVLQTLQKYKFDCLVWDLFPVQVLHFSWFHNSWILPASSNRLLYHREVQLTLPPECPFFCVVITKANAAT